MTIGQRIKEVRKNAGLTQRELAEKSGTATGTIQQYELGKRQPRLEQLEAIAAALSVSVGSLLGYETERVIIPGRLKIIETNDPESSHIQLHIEAADEEAYRYGLQILENAGVSAPAVITNTPVEGITVSANLDGVAAIEELYEKVTQARRGQKTYGGLTPDELCALHELNLRNRLDAAYARLNLSAHEKVTGFAEKLTKDPKYLADPESSYRYPPQQAPQSTPPARENTDTTPAETPPQRPQKGEE